MTIVALSRRGAMLAMPGTAPAAEATGAGTGSEAVAPASTAYSALDPNNERDGM